MSNVNEYVAMNNQKKLQFEPIKYSDKFSVTAGLKAASNEVQANLETPNTLLAFHII